MLYVFSLEEKTVRNENKGGALYKIQNSTVFVQEACH